MAGARDPDTLQKLSSAHLRAAAASWRAGERVAALKSSTPWEAEIDGTWFPSKAIVALAHRLAGLGELTRMTLAGDAARRRLQALGIPLRRATGRATPGDEKDGDLQVLQRHHIEAGAAAMREDMDFAIAQKHIADKPHETEWRVGIDGRWYDPRALGVNAYRAAGLTFDWHMADAAYARYRARLEELGFPVKRGRTPTRMHRQPWEAEELRSAAASLVGMHEHSIADPDDPLQVLLDGAAYPAGALLGLPAGAAPSDSDISAIAAADGILRAAPDPLDAALEALAAREGLPTEVSREIRARIGQGTFRSALLRLHGRCVVTGLALPAVLRAAHIHRWADCAETPDARLDLENGLLLSANLDCLFESGLIAFDADGGILISDALDAHTRESLGLHAGMRLAVTPSAAQQGYLAKHRQRTRAMRPEETL